MADNPILDTDFGFGTPPTLPTISPDFSQPLPRVDPNSDLVPYRMSRTDPSQGEVVTTGYGPRARSPIQPPGGGGVGVPDMTGFLGEAMQHLPVDEALKATQAAAQYIAQRGYQRDIANGESAPKALLKWLPVMRNSTGLSETLQFQQAQAKAAQPVYRDVGGRIYRVPPTGQAEAISPEPPPQKMTPYQQAEIDLRKKAAEKPAPMSPEDRAELTDAYKQLDEGRKDMAKLTQTLVPKSKQKEHQSAMDDATMRMRDARETIFKIDPSKRPARPDDSTSPFHQSAAAPAPQTPNPAATVKRVRVIGPGGRQGTVPEGATLPEGWKLAQ